MEKKFYQDNFEQLLKEAADNFRMYPSKRVWHSIYNDLHPGRRWPSFAVWLLLISSVAYIGVSNKSHITVSEKNSSAANTNTVGKNQPDLPDNTGNIASVQGNPGTTVVLNDHSRQSDQPQLTGRGTPNLSNQRTASLYNNNSTNITGNNKQDQLLPVDIGIVTNQPVKNPTLNADGNNQVSTAINIDDKDLTVTINTDPANTGTNDQQSLINGVKNPTNKKINNTDIALNDKNKKDDAKDQKKASTTNKSSNVSDKEWIEDYAFHNKPSISSWKARTSYQFYVTPSIGYRKLYETTHNMIPPGFSPNNPQGNQEPLSQVAAINMEIGGNIIYSFSKNANLKVGIQFNYTNYSINAYELKHPTMTMLVLNNLSTGLPELDPRSTELANSSGLSATRLKNNTYQLSIPIGVDFRLAGTDKLKWYAGATLQPTFVLGGHSYLISSDMNNYVADNSFIRKWNLNAGIETFISYKTKAGISINAGPQLRYQLLSTYSRQYSYAEKLYNIGLKFGITKRF